MRVFLSGPMGVGKSTVGRIVAERLDLTFFDLDRQLEKRAGRTVAEIFREQGETAFRSMEQRLVRELGARDNTLIALGGGTTVDPENRTYLWNAGLLLGLSAPLDTLLARVAGGEGRPLLGERAGSGIASRLKGLLERRRDSYAEVHARIDAAGDVQEVAGRVVSRINDQPMGVALGRRSYSIDVGPGLLDRIPLLLGDREVLTVADRNTVRYAPGDAFVLDPGEQNKTLDAVASIWDEALSRGLSRNSILLAVGGGVVGDLTGFAAASLLRGVAFAQIATSIIAMVDSSVGGKTGFNRPAGKNLVGAFHQPAFVLCDIDSLATLDAEEFRSGFAEVVKSVWLAGEAEVAEIEALAPAIVERDAAAVEIAVRSSIKLKARIVAADEREGGQRALLNLGHTFGHAFEAAAGYGNLRHGDAVALGLVAAADIAAQCGKLPRPVHERLVRLLEALQLPTNYRPRLDDRALAFLHHDKKRVRGGMIRFVLPGAPGGAELHPVSIEMLTRLIAK